MGTTPTYFDFSKTDPMTGRLVKNPYHRRRREPAAGHAGDSHARGSLPLLGTAQGDLSILSGASHSLNASLHGGIDALNDHNHIYSPPDTYIEQSGNISPYPGSVVDGNTDAVERQPERHARRPAHDAVRHRDDLGRSAAGARLGQFGHVVRGQGLFPGVTNFATAVQTGVTQTQLVTRTFSYFAQEEFLAMNERLMLTAAVNAERSSTNGDSARRSSRSRSSRRRTTCRFTRGTSTTSSSAWRPVRPATACRTTSSTRSSRRRSRTASSAFVRRRTVGLSGVTPEHTAETEGGADIELLHGRAQAEVTFYKKTTNDLVLQSAPPPSSGFTTKIINGGELTNSGQEIGLNILAMQNSLLTWQSHTTFSHNKGLVTSLPVPAFYTGSIFSERYGAHEGPGRVRSGRSRRVQRVQCRQVRGTRSSSVRRARISRWASPTTSRTAPSVSRRAVEWRHGGYLANLSQTYLEDVLGPERHHGRQLRQHRDGQHRSGRTSRPASRCSSSTRASPSSAKSR